jgi:Fic family protein
MRVTEEKYFDEYYRLIGSQIDSLIDSYDFSEINGNLGYKTKASAVYSSNIEGNTIDLNSFMNYKLSKEKFRQEKEIKEIENLISAYEFAQRNKLDEKNFLECHKMFSETLVPGNLRGKYRKEKIGVFGQSGLVYLAIEPEYVNETMIIFFSDLQSLLGSDLSKAQVFYFASLIHLIFAHIHPFKDGNGRAARLIEKWFIAEKSGKEFWKLQSEKYYKEHQQEYYNNIDLGVNYYELQYDDCIPFLLMLPECLRTGN